MTEGIRAQHPPAIRVGGRRLSMSMKPKAPIPTEAAVTNAAPETGDKTETTVLDYPRPAPPVIEDANQQNQQEVHRNEEEIPPKKFKKKNVQEYAQWKTETTRPTRDLNGGNKGQTMGVRIGQPAGKAFGV